MFFAGCYVRTTFLSLIVLSVLPCVAQDQDRPWVLSPDLTRCMSFLSGSVECCPMVFQQDPPYYDQQQTCYYYESQVKKPQVSESLWHSAFLVAHFAVSTARIVSCCRRVKSTDKLKATAMAVISGGLIAWQYVECMKDSQNVDGAAYAPLVAGALSSAAGAACGYLWS